MQLPLKQDLDMMQTKWASILNPVIANPLTNPHRLTRILLINGSTTINHGLEQMQQGWIITDMSAGAKIYRSQPFNAKTLTLTSDTAVTVDIVVF